MATATLAGSTTSFGRVRPSAARQLDAVAASATKPANNSWRKRIVLSLGIRSGRQWNCSARGADRILNSCSLSWPSFLWKLIGDKRADPRMMNAPYITTQPQQSAAALQDSKSSNSAGTSSPLSPVNGFSLDSKRSRADGSERAASSAQFSSYAFTS